MLKKYEYRGKQGEIELLTLGSSNEGYDASNVLMIIRYSSKDI